MERRGSRLQAPRWALGAACLLALVASLAGTASATTTPGQRYTIRVLVTDSNLMLVPQRRSGRFEHQFVHANGLSATFPRGALIRFVFVNNGSETYLPALRLLNSSNANPYEVPKDLYTAQRAVAPGGHGELFANFYFRGPFLLQALLHRQPHGKPARITIY